MKLINNPDRSQWAEILKRPVMNIENLFDTVQIGRASCRERV